MSTATIDEKIFQRQMRKQEVRRTKRVRLGAHRIVSPYQVADSVSSNGAHARNFSQKNLKQLFTLYDTQSLRACLWHSTARDKDVLLRPPVQPASHSV